jgi:hypothetical protein
MVSMATRGDSLTAEPVENQEFPEWFDVRQLYTYCTERRALESDKWQLVSRFSHATARLYHLTIALQSEAFLDAKAECAALKQQIAAAKERLEEHRCEHGC